MDADALFTDEECSELVATASKDTPSSPAKMLAPFLKTFKKREKMKADLVLDEYKEFYLRYNPGDLVANLQESFADPVKLATVLNETAELLRVVTASKSVNLYLVDPELGVLTLCPRYLQKNERFRVRYRIASGTTLAAYVAYKKEYVITGDVLGDSRFPEAIPGVDKTVKAALCVPVLGEVDGPCIGVIELYRDLHQPAYDSVALQIATALCGWAGIGVGQNTSKLKLLKEIEIHRVLLSITQLYFDDIIKFDKAISEIIVFSKATVNADKCTFYLLDEPVPFGSEETIYAEVYEQALDESKGLAVYRKKTKASFAYLKPGVVGYAARTSKTISIKDAYTDFRFDISSDPADYRTRSLLALPIKNERGVVGVLVMSNKLTGPFFTEEDVWVTEIFSGYGAVICEHWQLCRRNKEEDLKLEIAKELLFVHTKPPAEDLSAYKALPVLSAQQMPPGFFRFDWSTTVYEDEIQKYVIFAFLGSELAEPLFEQNNLVSFALSVKKAYRAVPYHNFDHAFTVFHFLYNVLCRNRDIFDENEIIAILIAGLCHDVDHTGVTNSFLELKKDPIAELYDEFPLEEHHFRVCLLLIQANNLMSEFSSEKYTEITNEIRYLILATNLSFFFRSKKEMVSLINEDIFDWNNVHHRRLMKGFLMVCGEYSANFRTFDFVRRNVDNIYRELFAQGDMERTMGLTPVAVMDRSQIAMIPDHHLEFLTTVVEPCTEIVVKLFPNCNEIIALCRDGMEKWKELVDLRGVEVWKPEESLWKEKKQRGPRHMGTSNYSSARSMQSVQIDQKSTKLE